MGWANNDFPIFNGIGHFIGTAHFGHAHSANNEDNKTWNILYLGLSFIFMPVTITNTLFENGYRKQDDEEKKTL